MRRFLMTEARRTAADLVAAGRLTQAEVAERVGVARSTLWCWRKRPEFRAVVEKHLEEFRARLRREMLAGVRARMRELGRPSNRRRRARPAG